MFDVVASVAWSNGGACGVEGEAQVPTRKGGGLSYEMFELGKGEFDRVGIGAVGRDIDDATAASLQEADDVGMLVEADVVHHDYLARPQRGSEDVANEVAKVVALHAAFRDGVTADASDIHGGDKRETTAAEIRGLGADEALPRWSPSA